MQPKITAKVDPEWLHAFGQYDYDDTSFLIVDRFRCAGYWFYELMVPWQEAPWVVAEWRLVVNGRL